MRRLLIWTLLLFSCHAMATLGMSGAVSPAPGSVHISGARLQSVQPSLYSVNESQLESGTTVREYSDLAGLVFAVEWSGPVMPDLNALLGIYFSVFQVETAQALREGRYRAAVNLNRDGVVVRSNGRMRNFFGHAYLPARVPNNVNIADVFQ